MDLLTIFLESLMETIWGRVLLGTMFWSGVAFYSAMLSDKLVSVYEDWQAFFRDYKRMKARKAK